MRFFAGLRYVWSVWSCVGACAVAFVACSGATESLLEEAAPGTTNVTDASTGSMSNADSSAPQVHDSGSPTKSDPDANTDPNPPDSSQTAPPPDAAPEKDSSPPPPADTITCGSASCDPTSQVCCISNDNGNQTFVCDTSQDCNDNGGLALPCAKAADCIAAGSPTGTVCCVSEGNGNNGGGNGGGGNGGGTTVACVPEVECLDTSSQAWMCDPNATASTSQCPAGETCTVSVQTIPPYSICK